MFAVIETHNALASPPACLPPWQENPYRLVSLLDMLRFHAEKFCRCSSLLGQIFVEIRAGVQPAGTSWSLIGSGLRELRTHCEEMGLLVTLAQIDRVNHMVQSDTGLDNLFQFGQELIQVQTRLNDELQSRLFLAISPEKVRFYSDDAEPFGHAVAVAFPSTSGDAREANKSLAVGRSTACVFHLMRVLELGLTAFANRFNVSSSHTNWHNVIEGIEKAVRNIATDPARPPDWRDQQEFFSQAASHFMVIKDAWRNYTAHARGNYTDEEAASLLGNVSAFMQKLATRLQE